MQESADVSTFLLWVASSLWQGRWPVCQQVILQPAEQSARLHHKPSRVCGTDFQNHETIYFNMIVGHSAFILVVMVLKLAMGVTVVVGVVCDCFLFLLLLLLLFMIH